MNNAQGSSRRRPEVTVVIPAYNAARWVGGQLEALSRQNDAPDFEVVVVDNRSTDDLGAVVGGFDDRLDVRVVDAFAKAGVCHARNAGAVAARGRVLLICDADDEVDERWVRELSDAVGEGGRLAAGALDYARFNSDMSRRVLDGTDRWRPAPYMGYLPFAFGCNLGITREDYLAVGGMDESIVGGSDDVEFSWRAQEAGLDFVSVPSALVHYRLRETPKAVFRQRRAYQRGDVLVWARSLAAGRPVGGKSLKWSMMDAVVNTFRGWRYPFMNAEQRLAWGRRTGGSLGALEGHLRYRLFRGLPQAHLIEGQGA